MGIDHLALFVVAGIALNLTPGPDVLYIVTNALRSGARAGIVAALGITAGCFVHILAAAIGVSALMAASATAFTLLKWAGAAYLVVVGLRMLLARARAPGAKVEAAGGMTTLSKFPSPADPARELEVRVLKVTGERGARIELRSTTVKPPKNLPDDEARFREVGIHRDGTLVDPNNMQ